MLKFLYDASGNLAIQGQGDVLPPQIIGQPIMRIIEPGQIAGFSVVVANASGVTFQWKFNGADIPGATGDSLLLTNVTSANQGQYSAVVKNSAGSVTSAPAALLLDTDRDGLPDSWEIANFGNLTSQRGAGDPDGDRVSNIDEFLDGTNPKSNASLRPRLTAYSDAGGSVTVAPMKLTYELGETVTLTAKPFAPSVFLGWTGDLKTTSNPATLKLNGNKTVRARFASVVPLPPGLIAFWRADTDANDLIGGHHGKFFTGTTATVPSVTPSGKIGGAFSFDGTVYVQIPDANELHPDQITAEGWVFPKLLSGAPQTIIARGSRTSEDDTWWLGVTNGKPQFWSKHVGSGMVLLESPATIPLNEWTHLAISFDGATKRLYVNGAQIAWQGGLGNLVYEPATVPVTIGSDWGNNATTARFTGFVDEVALYKRALSINEVYEIYNADFLGKDLSNPYFTSDSLLPRGVAGVSLSYKVITVLGKAPITFSLSAGQLPPGVSLSSAGLVNGLATASGIFSFTVRATDAGRKITEQLCVLQILDRVPAPAGLVGWWKAEGNAQDSAGSNHGILQSGTGFSAGEVGQSFSFDGTKGCIEIPDAPALRPSSVTLEAWVAFDAITDVRVIIAKPVGGGTSDSYALWLQNGSLKAAVGDAAGIGTILSVAFSLVLGRWYHIAYTFDNSTKHQALYVDSIQVAAGTASKSVGYDSQPLLLGRDTESGAKRFFFQGRIDETSIYNRALNAAEIASIFNAGPAGKR